jgi:hypothetical protein
MCAKFKFSAKCGETLHYDNECCGTRETQEFETA